MSAEKDRRGVTVGDGRPDYSGLLVLIVVLLIAILIVLLGGLGGLGWTRWFGQQ